jgi:hypothetical protein
MPKTITENGTAFAYLTIADVETIEALIRKRNTDAFNAQITEQKDITPQIRMQLWAQVRPDRVLNGDIYDFCRYDRTGIVETLKLAATKAGSVGTFEIDMPNAGNLAAHLLGLCDRDPIMTKDNTVRPTTAG